MPLAIELILYFLFASRSTDKVRSSLYVELMLHLMHTMHKNRCACYLSILCMKKKCLIIGLIENEKNYFMNRKFMDSAEVRLKFVGL